METLETIDYKGYQIHIHPDNNPGEGPRDWDNLGTMACWHRLYSLGDDDGPELLKEAIRQSPYYRDSWEDYGSDNMLDLDDPADLISAAEKCPDILMLPLYLYDHGGITMSVGSFSCPWDSGQVGAIFVTKEKIRKEYDVKRITRPWITKILQYLEDEVKVYDFHISGQVYGYSVTDQDGGEIDAGCWGFYGWDHEVNGLIDHAQGDIDAEIDRRMKGHILSAIAAAKTEYNNAAYGAGI